MTHPVRIKGGMIRGMVGITFVGIAYIMVCWCEINGSISWESLKKKLEVWCPWRPNKSEECN
jgi:hypothetical protein